jgi:hypothetical protein
MKLCVYNHGPCPEDRRQFEYHTNPLELWSNYINPDHVLDISHSREKYGLHGKQ